MMMKFIFSLLLCQASYMSAETTASFDNEEGESSLLRRRAQVTLPEGAVTDPGCFSATTSVWVADKGEVLMKDLQVGDKVLTGGGGGNNRFQPIYSFGHHEEDRKAEFFQLYTDNNNKEDPLVEMTGNHLIYVVRQGEDRNSSPLAVRADSVKVGDALVQQQQQEQHELVSITKVTTTHKRGLYMPLTADGTIVVNGGILASNYVSIQEEAPAVVTTTSDVFYLSQDAVLHWWLSPYRMLCLGVSPNFCRGPNNTAGENNGILQWLLVGKNFAEYADQQNWMIRVFLIGIPTFVVFAIFNLVETILGGPSLAPMVALLLISGLSWILGMRRNQVGAKNRKMD